MAGKQEPGPTAERVAAAVQRLRRERGLSYAELSRRLTAAGHPILDTGLMKIEKGQRRVDVDDLVALAVALGVTPNLLLLPQTDFKNPRETIALTPGPGEVRSEDAWAWAYGERPLGHKSASFADEKPARAELEFIAANRRYYAYGGFGWLGGVSGWLETAGEQGAAPPDVSLKVQGSGLIAGAVLGAYTKYGLDTSDIRAAAESAVMAALVEEEPEKVEKGLAEVVAWLVASGDDDEEEGDS